jgi:hypothetical protein
MYFDTWTQGDGQVRVRVYEGDPPRLVFERSDTVRIYGVSDLTMCEQAGISLARITDSSGPLLSTDKFTAVVDHPTAAEDTSETVHLDGTVINAGCTFANITDSQLVPAGIYVYTPHGSGIARIAMRLLHDFNLYQHERSHDI